MKLTEEQKAIAEQVSKEIYPNLPLYITTPFAERFLSALAEKQEPVAIVKHAVGGPVVHLIGNVKPQTLLYAAPVFSPDVEKLEAENQSLKAELEAANLVFNQCSGLLDDALRSIESIEDQLEAARKDAEWQPIETAPKDGSRFLTTTLLTNGKFGQIGISHVFFCHVVNHVGWKVAGDDPHATHWKPLPAPPAIEQAKGAKS